MPCPNDDTLISFLFDEKGTDLSHLSECETCRDRLDALRLMLEISLAQLEFLRAPVVPASADTVARIMNRIKDWGDNTVGIQRSPAQLQIPVATNLPAETERSRSGVTRWTTGIAVAALFLTAWLIQRPNEVPSNSERQWLSLLPIVTDSTLASDDTSALHKIDADHWQIVAKRYVRVQLECSEGGFANLVLVDGESVKVFPQGQRELELLPRQSKLITVPVLGKKMLILGVVSNTRLSSLLSAYTDVRDNKQIVDATVESASKELIDYLKKNGADTSVVKGQQWEFIQSSEP